MAGIIRTLFKSKKSSKKDEENQEDLARDVSSRRSYRAPNSSSSKSQRHHVARFADDGALSATAAYHTNNAPKLRKGPQSCPGGYRDESDASFEDDKYSQKSGHHHHRKRDVLSQSMRQNHQQQSFMIDEGRKSGSRRQKSFGRRRGESSEYGSGDPSPVGHYSSRHSHYEDRINESENDDFPEKDQFAVIERAQHTYMQKYKESEQKRREEKRRLKQMEKEANDAKNAMFHYMNQLDKVKKERDCYRKELGRCKKQLEMLQNGGFDSFHHLRQPQQLQNPQQYPPALTMPSYFMNPQMSASHHMPPTFMTNAPPTSNTPMTMASGGAGESLTNPSDISFLQNTSSFLANNSQVLSGVGGMTPSPAFKVPANFTDDDTDEVKDYRSELLIETARLASSSLADTISLSPTSSADSQVTLMEATMVEEKENRKPRPFSQMSI